ncbi:MAG: exonuclease [Crenarchaeota archaeon]|nr:exonuclease [Thermoproteota archaeon]
MHDGLVVLLHDVSSAQRLIDTARLVYGLGLRSFVASKVYGAAASSGVPEASRMAMKLGRLFAVLPSARDAVELLQPDAVIVVSRDYGEPLEASEIAEKLAKAKKPLLVLGGIDAAPSKDVAALGEALYIAGVEHRLGPVAEAAIILAALRGLSRP